MTLNPDLPPMARWECESFGDVVYLNTMGRVWGNLGLGLGFGDVVQGLGFGDVAYPSARVEGIGEIPYLDRVHGHGVFYLKEHRVRT